MIFQWEAPPPRDRWHGLALAVYMFACGIGFGVVMVTAAVLYTLVGG